MKQTTVISIIVFCAIFSIKAQSKPEAILGKWISIEGKVMVEVFKEQNYFSAKLIWFDDSRNKDRPMNERLDENNPDKMLRERKLIGLIILKNLIYNSDEKRWKNGKIYDCTSGKMWDSTVWFENPMILKVRGFMHFNFIGQTMSFRKV